MPLAWQPERGPLVQMGGILCLLGLVLLTFCRCDRCKEDVKERCNKDCDRHGTCVITYSYNSRGEQNGSKRECRWISKPDLANCAKCTDLKKNAKGLLISKTCVVCNLCSEDFECLESSECKGSTSICDRGICVGCRDNADCKNQANRQLCVKGQCAGCQDDRNCKTKQKPQCHQNECVACRCAQVDDGKSVCIQKSDYSVICVECTQDDHCKGEKPTCNTKSRTCIAECGATKKCGDGKFCVNGKCGECRDAKDCTDPQAPRCFGGTCLCTSDQDCGGTYPKCKVNRCVECFASGDCKAPFEMCKSGACDLRPCKPENAGKDCPSSPFNRCLSVGRKTVCVECTTTKDCASGKTCDLGCFCCR